MTAILLHLFEFENPEGGKIEMPVKPAGKRFAVGAEKPAKPYMIKMKLREC